MYDSSIETVEYIWVNISYMPEWNLSQKHICRNTRLFHTVQKLLRSAKVRHYFGWQT